MSLTTQQLLVFYSKMTEIRFFEKKLAELFSKGTLGGTSHFCIGEEACAVGVIQAADSNDWLISNHRGHGHLLSRNLDVERVFGELFGRLSGYCRGRGGSQHMCAMDKHFLGTNGITGGGIPIGTGAALALKYKKDPAVAIVFFGDGASNQGTFHESLNMASLWKLPVLYVCENNRYGMSNPVAKSCAGGRVLPRAISYGIAAEQADGMNVETVYTATQKALAFIHSGKGPYLLELMTYRHCGHSKNDPRVYRTRQEEAKMLEQDCIKQCADALLAAGISQEEIDSARATSKKKIDFACETALAAPVGGENNALGGVYA